MLKINKGEPWLFWPSSICDTFPTNPSNLLLSGEHSFEFSFDFILRDSSDIQKTILGNNLTGLRNFQLTPPPTPGGIITAQSFKDLYRAGGRGSDFRDLGIRLSRQKKNRFPCKVTKEVQAVLKEIDNRIIAKGDITIKKFNSLSEIQKNQLRRIEEPSIAELFPFLKFAEGGMVPESLGLANLLAV